MKRILKKFFVPATLRTGTSLLAAFVALLPGVAPAQYVRWTYSKNSPCDGGACSTVSPAAPPSPAPTGDVEKSRLENKLEELARKVERLEEKDAVITVQPPEDPNSLKSDPADVVTQYPTPDDLRRDARDDPTGSVGRWTTGGTQQETARVDRIMQEMAQEFGFDLDALDKVWKKFPVYYVGQRGYAGCTFWENGRVRCIEIVSLYDDNSDRVLRHELIHATLFYLVQNEASLFMHEATTQQSEPGVRSAYVSRMQSALASDRAFNISSWYGVDTYNGYGMKLYTYSYGVSEYLTSLGGKEWYFSFVLDYCRNGFDSALRDYYGMTLEQFNDGLQAFYTKNAARRESLKSLLEK